MKIVKVTSKEELEKLEKIVNEKLELVKTVRDSFGWDCFTEEPEQKIKVLRKLNELLIFSVEPDDLNEQLAELELEDPKTYSIICRFIKIQLSNQGLLCLRYGNTAYLLQTKEEKVFPKDHKNDDLQSGRRTLRIMRKKNQI